MNDSKEHIERSTPFLEFSKRKIWKILETVTDPEVPVLTVIDLGIIRDIKINDTEIEVVITPTYTGCPAMDMIAANIRMELLMNGYKNVKITSVLSPAWTTGWMTEAGKEKLKAYGIAPPQAGMLPNDRVNKLLFEEETKIKCPLCNSTHTKLISEFGSTACKALYKCNDCKEPFDYFKCH